MMMGIVFTILGMVLTVYVPIWAKSLEAQHMEEVSDTFTEMKSTVDEQIAQGDLGTKMSTRVKLGTEGGPLLGLGQTTGALTFNPSHSMLSVYNSNDIFEKYGTGRGEIVFSAGNIYYVDQQYVYENGAVILDQAGSTLMKVEPNIYVSNVSDSTTCSIVLITLQGDLENIGGIKSQAVITNLLSVNKDTTYWGESSRPGSGRNITLAVNTSYPEVWNEYFVDLLEKRSRLNETDYTIQEPVQVGDTDDWILEVIIRDINVFTTTIAYIDVSVT
jgi:hypothetical protein